MDTNLCVIGAGPTGIAALVEASSQGIDAIGLEKADISLASISAHMRGTTYLSRADHFELPGIPLDCPNASACRREDVLRYYHRVINHSGIKIHNSSRCVSITPTSDSVLVSLEVAGRVELLRANFVIATNWYQPRQVRIVGEGIAGNPPVFRGLRSAVEYLGDHVVVIGGGLSGIEFTRALIRSGHRVTVVARGSRTPIHDDRLFVTLVEQNRSEIVFGAREISLVPRGVSFVTNGRARTVYCDAVVTALGQQIDYEWLQCLLNSGTISETLARHLTTAPSWEQVVRETPGLSSVDRQELVVSARPDLWSHLLLGYRGIRLAGSALHIGAANAGAKMSIATGILAVRSLAERNLQHCIEPPLHRALLQLENLDVTLSKSRTTDLWKTARPLCVPMSKKDRMDLNSSLISATDRPASELELAVERFLMNAGLTPERDLLHYALRMLGHADGTRTVSELAKAFGVSKPLDVDTSSKLIAAMSRNGFLTWLPRSPS